MTVQQQTKLDHLERQMRDNAFAIQNLTAKMVSIDPTAANKALDGIIQYLQERRDEIPS